MNGYKQDFDNHAKLLEERLSQIEIKDPKKYERASEKFNQHCAELVAKENESQIETHIKTEEKSEEVNLSPTPRRFVS